MPRRFPIVAAPILLIAACGGDQASSGPPVAPPPALTEPVWQLVWSDEFSSSRIDSSKWALAVDCWGGGNDERQCYTDRPENARVADGRLIITARREDFTGSALPLHLLEGASDPDALATKPFTSAKLVTRNLASWKYGRIEIRAKLPQVQGTWPALWMLPESDVYGKWAASGEIDIMEAVNLGVPCIQCPGGLENTILGTLHFGGVWPDNALASTEHPFPSVLDGFHTYGVIWTEGRFQWLVDGQAFATRTASEWFTTGSQNPNAPFDQAFHLIMNLAIGGKLPEGRGVGGISKEGFPKTMEIDWVRVWKCSDEALGGANCQGTGSGQ